MLKALQTHYGPRIYISRLSQIVETVVPRSLSTSVYPYLAATSNGGKRLPACYKDTVHVGPTVSSSSWNTDP